MHRKYILKSKKQLREGELVLLGSYGEKIGVSTGSQLDQGYILYSSVITQKEYKLTKLRERKFEIEAIGGFVASLIIHMRHTRFVLDCPDNSRYLFVSEDGRNSYRIMHELEEVGIVSCSQWNTDTIGLVIRVKQNIDFIVATLIAIGL